MDVFEAIRTTRAMRRLDPDRPVADDAVRTIIDAAIRGPSGGNRQPTRWIVVRDAGVRRALGDIYRECWTSYRAAYASSPGASDTPILRSADHLGEHMGEAPVLVVPVAPPGADSSVYPGVQNLFLAARALGLGTTLTTVHRLQEDRVREVLGIPDDRQTYALIPVGHPLGRWGEAARRPYEELVFEDHWGTPPAAAAAP